MELVAKYALVKQIYKAEAGALGFSITSAVCLFLGVDPGIAVGIGTVVGYVLAYLKTKA